MDRREIKLAGTLVEFFAMSPLLKSRLNVKRWEHKVRSTEL